MLLVLSLISEHQSYWFCRQLTLLCVDSALVLLSLCLVCRFKLIITSIMAYISLLRGSPAEYSLIYK